MTGDDEGFLRRWSRLKQDGEKAEPEEPGAERSPLPARGQSDEAAESGEVEDAATRDEIDEAASQELELPDIDSLDKDSDYTAFMREGVPDALRRRALRKLWLSDPVLANLDGLNDYDEDFAALFQTVSEVTQKVSDAARSMADDSEGEEKEGEEEETVEEGVERPEDEAPPGAEGVREQVEAADATGGGERASVDDAAPADPDGEGGAKAGPKPSPG